MSGYRFLSRIALHAGTFSLTEKILQAIQSMDTEEEPYIKLVPQKSAKNRWLFGSSSMTWQKTSCHYRSIPLQQCCVWLVLCYLFFCETCWWHSVRGIHPLLHNVVVHCLSKHWLAHFAERYHHRNDNGRRLRGDVQWIDVRFCRRAMSIQNCKTMTYNQLPVFFLPRSMHLGSQPSMCC